MGIPRRRHRAAALGVAALACAFATTAGARPHRAAVAARSLPAIALQQPQMAPICGAAMAGSAEDALLASRHL